MFLQIKVKTIVCSRNGEDLLRKGIASVETMETIYWVHIVPTVGKSGDKKDEKDPLCTGCPKKVLDRISYTKSHVDLYHPT